MSRMKHATVKREDARSGRGGHGFAPSTRPAEADDGTSLGQVMVPVSVVLKETRTRLATVLLSVLLLTLQFALAPQAQAKCLTAYHSHSVSRHLGEVLEHSGIPSTNFEVRASDEVPTARAATCRGDRYIYVNERWMNRIHNGDWDWKGLSVLAHEIGHHVLGHVVTSEHSHKNELEADRYSGHLLYHLGASLDQSIELVSRLRRNRPILIPAGKKELQRLQQDGKTRRIRYRLSCSEVPFRV